jgi:hypothetical protein
MKYSLGKRANDVFGINIKEYCKNHEKKILSAIDSGLVTEEIIELHREKISIIQHERLVHLIVTVMVVLVELFVISLTVLHPELGLLPPIIMLGLAILLGFYFYHYFFLENTLQHWYRLLEFMESGDDF